MAWPGWRRVDEGFQEFTQAQLALLRDKKRQNDCVRGSDSHRASRISMLFRHLLRILVYRILFLSGDGRRRLVGGLMLGVRIKEPLHVHTSDERGQKGSSCHWPRELRTFK